jgi:2-haloacid dehalogenase
VVTAIVFDIGNVLLRWDPRNLYRKIFPKESQMEWFLAHVCDGPWNEEQDRGRSWGEAILERCALFPDWHHHIRAYDERWLEMLAGEVSDNVRVLRGLKQAGQRTYAITNFSREKFALARLHYDFFDLFDGIVVSGEEGLLKPDQRIFQRFLERYRLKAQQCIFIDDNNSNVAAACSLGMAGIHYQESLDLMRALAECGVMVEATPSSRADSSSSNAHRPVRKTGENIE